MIYFGTCGFSYKDWIGPFYPGKTRQSEMLPYYARCFPAVEIDASYYGVLADNTIARMNAATPAEFRFCFKVPASITHESTNFGGRVSAEGKAFAQSVAPLIESGKFGCALLQFPNSFRPGDATRDYVRRVAEALHAVPLVAEFRHREWQRNETLDLLGELGVGWCNVDMPQLDSLLHAGADVTSRIGYIRFHGRNAAQWWTGTNVTRYDYLYTADELVPWVDRVAEVDARVETTYAFFNNHARGNSARNAELFGELLRSRFGAAANAVIRREGAPAQPSLFE